MEVKNSNLGSYNGLLLRLDLSNSTWKTEKILHTTYKRVIGGRGLGVQILSDELEAKADPLEDSNKLVFATGPLTGTTGPTGCRYEVVTKSPLTNTITTANAGGFFGAVLKKSGYDALVIEGRAERPQYLWINNGEVMLRDARRLWGLTTHQTTDRIKTDVGVKSISVAAIGPAGERLVKFAGIINDKHRAAGRGGVGAIMGKKNLKAVAVRGTKKISVFNPETFQAKTKEIIEKFKQDTVINVNLRRYGTPKILSLVNDYKLFGTRNFQQNYFEHADDINAEKLNETILIKKRSCYRCPIACKSKTQVEKVAGEGPEFETIWAFGAQCGVNDLKAIARANYLCNELGLDTISTGNTIGTAMELSGKQIIDDELKFGDPVSIIEFTKAIGYRDGLGDNLAEGSYNFAESVGHDELSMSCKKLELPAYDPRGAQAQGLGYATSNRGGCHTKAFVIKSDISATSSEPKQEDLDIKAKLVRDSQDLIAVVDSMGMCLFSSFVCGIDDYLVLLESATGLGISDTAELLQAGERIWTLEKMFNHRAGFTRDDDKLPQRFIVEKIEDSLGNKHVWPEKGLLDSYYKERGWSAKGVPTKAKLAELGISF